MLEFHSGSSNAVKTTNAVQESLDLALKDIPDDHVRLVMVHSTMGHNFTQLLKAVHERCPQAEIVGCTGSGVISSEGVSEKMRALALLVVTGDECAVASVSGIGNENSGELARSCAQSLADKLSGINMVPRLHLTRPSCRPAVTTSIPARRSKSMTVTASSSSQPWARGMRTRAMILGSFAEQ